MTLFEIKHWEIRKFDNPEVNGVNVTAHHTDCAAEGEDDISWFANESPVCWNCKANVPDEIQGLMYLHEGLDYGYNQ